jgi:hypothetical protein
MNLVDELSSELALTFLVEKKYAGKVKTNEAVSLIGKIKDVLQTTEADERTEAAVSKIAGAKGISH